MKVGVFVSKREPLEGGGYTITEELINKLIKKINSKKIKKKFFFVVSNDHKNLICNKLKKNKISFTKINEIVIFKKFLIFISHLFPKINCNGAYASFSKKTVIFIEK